MEVKNVKIGVLKPYERNNKKHPQEQVDLVAESIKQYGFVQPIVCDKDNVVVIGHCRLLAAKKLKLKEVPVVYVEDLTDEQVRKLRILDNKTNESPWDFDNLQLELDELDFTDFGDLDFGFDNPEVLDIDINESTSDIDFTKEKHFECTCPNCGFKFVPIKEEVDE